LKTRDGHHQQDVRILTEETMIAPRKDELIAVAGETRLHRARRVAASMLSGASRKGQLPPVPAWQSWALVAWMLTVTGAYAWMMVSAVFR
jgi:hypothetical protein